MLRARTTKPVSEGTSAAGVVARAANEGRRRNKVRAFIGFLCVFTQPISRRPRKHQWGETRNASRRRDAHRLRGHRATNGVATALRRLAGHPDRSRCSGHLRHKAISNSSTGSDRAAASLLGLPLVDVEALREAARGRVASATGRPSGHVQRDRVSAPEANPSQRRVSNSYFLDECVLLSEGRPRSSVG